MANRETYPAAQSPLTGDISGPAGASSVKVVGIQTNPVSPSTPADQANLTWSDDLGMWIPQVPPYTVALEDVEGGLTVISNDWEIYINGIGTEVLVDWPYSFDYQLYINGTGVVGSEQ